MSQLFKSASRLFFALLFLSSVSCTQLMGGGGGFIPGGTNNSTSGPGGSGSSFGSGGLNGDSNKNSDENGGKPDDDGFTMPPVSIPAPTLQKIITPGTDNNNNLQIMGSSGAVIASSSMVIISNHSLEISAMIDHYPQATATAAQKMSDRMRLLDYMTGVFVSEAKAGDLLPDVGLSAAGIIPDPATAFTAAPLPTDDSKLARLCSQAGVTCCDTVNDDGSFDCAYPNARSGNDTNLFIYASDGQKLSAAATTKPDTRLSYTRKAPVDVAVTSDGKAVALSDGGPVELIKDENGYYQSDFSIQTPTTTNVLVQMPGGLTMPMPQIIPALQMSGSKLISDREGKTIAALSANEIKSYELNDSGDVLKDNIQSVTQEGMSSYTAMKYVNAGVYKGIYYGGEVSNPLSLGRIYKLDSSNLITGGLGGLGNTSSSNLNSNADIEFQIQSGQSLFKKLHTFTVDASGVPTAIFEDVAGNLRFAIGAESMASNEVLLESKGRYTVRDVVSAPDHGGLLLLVSDNNHLNEGILKVEYNASDLRLKASPQMIKVNGRDPVGFVEESGHLLTITADGQATSLAMDTIFTETAVVKKSASLNELLGKDVALDIRNTGVVDGKLMLTSGGAKSVMLVSFDEVNRALK